MEPEEKGKTHSNTEWHNIVSWRNLTDLAEKYLTKGSTIYPEGKVDPIVQTAKRSI